MKRNDQVKLGDIYGTMLESVKTVKHEGKYKNTDNAFTKPNKLVGGGPDKADGYNKAMDDNDCDFDEDEEDYEYDGTVKGIKELKEKIKNESDPTKKSRLEAKLKEREKAAMGAEDEETLKESKKIAKTRLNKFMAKKSTFDKLFESVMSESWMDDQEDTQGENDALGLGEAPTDDEFSDDLGGEEESVTFTLDRATAQALVDVLQASLGGEEGDDLDFEDEGGDDFDFEDEDQEDEMDFEEDEEGKVHPTDKVGNDGTVGTKDGKGGGSQHSLQGRNNKVGGKPQAKGQGTKVVGVTDKTGNDGDHGHAIRGGKQPNMGKQNKVSDLRQAEDFFR